MESTKKEQLEAEYGRIVLQLEYLQAQAQAVKRAIQVEMQKPKSEPVDHERIKREARAKQMQGT